MHFLEKQPVDYSLVPVTEDSPLLGTIPALMPISQCQAT